MKEYADDLFRYLETCERNYASFDTEAFIQTYQGIIAVFNESRKQRDKVVQLDQLFLDRIKQASLTTSDIREITLQVMITHFESVANIDGQGNQSYTFCRGLRSVRQDVAFFEGHLAPLLFRDGSLNNNFRLNAFFMGEMARYLNRFGKKLKADLTPEEFAALSEPLKYLELARRRAELGTQLLQDRASLEFHLRRIDAFRKMREKSRLAEYYLREWQYLATATFWSKLKGLFGQIAGKARGAFSSSRYFRLVIAQRQPAYFVYLLLIILFLWLAFFVPRKWSDFSDRRLQIFKQKAPGQEIERPGT